MRLSVVIEILAFRLAPGTDEDAFVAADSRVQTEFAYRQPGLLRRTTARADDGGWVVIDLWRSWADAEACEAVWGNDDVTAGFMTLVDPDTVTARRYRTLG